MVYLYLQVSAFISWLEEAEEESDEESDWVWNVKKTGFPLIREFRENFEDFFQSGKSGKNRGFSAKIREKNLKS